MFMGCGECGQLDYTDTQKKLLRHHEMCLYPSVIDAVPVVDRLERDKHEGWIGR